MYQVFLEETWSWSSLFSSSGTNFQRTMTICVARLLRGNLGHDHRLFLSHYPPPTHRPPPLTPLSGLSKRCFWQTVVLPGDTRHFCHFCRFPGFKEQNPLFLWEACKIVGSMQNQHFRQFSSKEPPVFGKGQNDRFPKRPFPKNLLMPLFLMGCFPVDFQEVKRPLRTKSVKRPIKVGKRPINEGKRPIKAKVLVSVSVGC